MTLRLSDDQSEALRARAAFEGRSMQEVAKSAIEEYLGTHIRADLIDRVMAEQLPRYAEAMRRLAE
ncbi:MAG: FitA-like ribbon-helix-helix domain-containing protein [Candidatus Nanopelagicales bacterium]